MIYYVQLLFALFDPIRDLLFVLYFIELFDLFWSIVNIYIHKCICVLVVPVNLFAVCSHSFSPAAVINPRIQYQKNAIKCSCFSTLISIRNERLRQWHLVSDRLQLNNMNLRVFNRRNLSQQKIRSFGEDRFENVSFGDASTHKWQLTPATPSPLRQGPQTHAGTPNSRSYGNPKTIKIQLKCNWLTTRTEAEHTRIRKQETQEQLWEQGKAVIVTLLMNSSALPSKRLKEERRSEINSQRIQITNCLLSRRISATASITSIIGEVFLVESTNYRYITNYLLHYFFCLNWSVYRVRERIKFDANLFLFSVEFCDAVVILEVMWIVHKWMLSRFFSCTCFEASTETPSDLQSRITSGPHVNWHLWRSSLTSTKQKRFAIRYVPVLSFL